MKVVNWNSEEYWSGIELRNKLLKTSAGKEWIKNLPLDEEKDIHLAAMIDGKVVGTLLLSKKSQTTAQIKQVAISDSYQGFGLGKKLLKFAEKIAELLDFQSVYLTGRKQAWGFYDHFGYQSIGYAYSDGQVILKKFEKKLYTNKGIGKFGIIKYITLREMETNG
ncbi:GNAT family N-acetyltransferase [Enterococcus caccae]|uniref:GNAT family N-acetyltransferase n=1 Tax=Enterococcus caccae TaxID=317735 RepID=UPI00039AAA6F|nr:GNAT family N-acetyltransferase [Enterococcus caccae]